MILGHNYMASSTAPTVISDEKLNTKIRSLNPKKWEYFKIVYNWAKIFFKHLPNISPVAIQHFIYLLR